MHLNFLKSSAILKTLLVAILTAMVSYGCGSKDESSKLRLADSIGIVSVDSLLNNADSIVGKKVTVEGICQHLDKYEGRRAYLVGSSDSITLRCDATSALREGFFPKEVIGKKIRVTGLLQEQRIDETYLQQLEASFDVKYQELILQGDTDEVVYSGGEARYANFPWVKAGQANPDSMFRRVITDYRAAIEQLKKTTGKDYVSQYFLDTIKIEIVE